MEFPELSVTIFVYKKFYFVFYIYTFTPKIVVSHLTFIDHSDDQLFDQASESLCAKITPYLVPSLKLGGIEQTTDNIKRIITEIKNNKLTIKQSQEAAVDQIRRMIRDMNKIDSMPNKKTNVGHRETLSKSTFGLYNEAINYYNGQFKNVADKSIDDVVDLIGKGVENMEIIGKYSFSRFPSSYELFNKTTKKIVDGLIDDSVNFSMDIKDIKSRIKEKIGDIKFPIINQEEMYNNSASKDSGSKVSEFKKKSTPAPVSSDLPDTINNSQALIDAYIDTCSDTNNIEIDLEIKKLEEHITKLANQGNAEKFKIIQNFDAEDDSKMISVSVNDIVIKLSEETGGWIRVHSLKHNKAGWIPNDCL
ncbi:MAG: hypothetical protein MHPSP_000091 [Paramarteilia canceri]